MSALAQAALSYAPRAVMLLGKRPAVGSAWPRWHATPEAITDWIAENGHRPDANVGIRTGRGLVALDIDVKDDGHVALERLEHLHGLLPATAEVATGSGGRHLYFSTDRELDIRSRNLRHSGIAGIEIKALGAQLVAPPSVHPDTGREYVWIRPLTEVAPLPDWVAGLGQSRKPRVITDGGVRRGCSDRIAQLQRRDPLCRIPGEMYVPRLTGRQLDSRGYVACPIHGDEQPSLKVYPDAGWYCFGCGVGGGIYQLAALLGGWTLPLSGSSFQSVRALLICEFAQEMVR